MKKGNRPGFRQRWGVALLLWGGVVCGTVHAQTGGEPTYTVMLRGVPLPEALAELVRLTGMNLVYSSELVGQTPVYCTRRDAPVEALLQCVLAGSDLDYIRSSSGAYVLIDALEERPHYGDLGGSVVDAETGEALPYAHVLLAEAATGTTTNAAGLFNFAALLSGMHHLVVTYVGYAPVVDSVYLAAGDRIRLRIALQPRQVSMAPVVIDGLEQRLPSSRLGTGALSGRELNARSGPSDVIRGAGTVPGVAATQPLADLHIQGGASGEHLTLLDGVPVRDPVSLGRYLGAFSPLAIDRLTVHKAGFGAEQGSHLSGVVAVEHDVTGPHRRDLAVSVDPVSLNGKVQSRFALGAGREGALMLALRASAWDLYRDRGVETLLQNWHRIDPFLASRWLRESVTTASLVQRPRPSVGFSDAHAALRLHLSPFRTLYVSAYRARNHITSDLTAVNADAATTEDRLVLTRDNYDWVNWAAQVRHSWLLDARTTAAVQVNGSWHDSHYAYHAIQTPVGTLETPEQVDQAAAVWWPRIGEFLGNVEQNSIREAALKGTLTHSFAPGREMEAGVALTHTDSRFLLGSPFVARLEHAERAWDAAVYGKGTFSLGLATTLEPGLRLTYVPLRRTVYAEPRLAVRFDRSASPVGPFALRLAGGIYRQFINQFEVSSTGTSAIIPSILFWLPVDRSLAPPRAYHLAAEALFMPAPAWTLRLETYYKDQPHLLDLDYAALLAVDAGEEGEAYRAEAQADFISPARGHAYGGSARLTYARDGFETVVSYGYSRAVRQFPGRFDGRQEPTPWNEPHRLAVDIEARLLPHLTLGLNARSSRGRRWAFRRAYYDYLSFFPSILPAGTVDLTRPAAHEVPPYYRLDAGLTYTCSLGRTVLRVQAYVVNLFDRRNVYDRRLEQTTQGTVAVDRRLPGRYPMLALRLDY